MRIHTWKVKSAVLTHLLSQDSLDDEFAVV